MELISKYFNWCERERRSGIDLVDRVSTTTSEKEGEEVIVGIRANGKNEVYIYWEVFGILLLVKG